MLSTKNIQEISENISKNLTEDVVLQCNKLLEGIIHNISNVIVNYLSIHNKVYKNNDYYKKFIHMVFDEASYNKLISSGELRKSVESMENSRSLGLFKLTKNIFGLGNKSIEKKFDKFLEAAEIVINSFIDARETGSDFIVYFLTILHLKQIVLKVLLEDINNIKF